MKMAEMELFGVFQENDKTFKIGRVLENQEESIYENQ